MHCNASLHIYLQGSISIKISSNFDFVRVNMHCLSWCHPLVSVSTTFCIFWELKDSSQEVVGTQPVMLTISYLSAIWLLSLTKQLILLSHWKLFLYHFRSSWRPSKEAIHFCHGITTLVYMQLNEDVVLKQASQASFFRSFFPALTHARPILILETPETAKRAWITNLLTF